MTESYDIFLSHSGAQKGFVEQLYRELSQYGRYSIFFDEKSINFGEQISPIILEYAKTCKLAVAVLSEEYFTTSRPPMMELAASYTAAKNGNGLPCLLPVFFALKPEHAKDFESQMEWFRTWQEWELNEIMSERKKGRTGKVQSKVWKEALDSLLDTRGPVYEPHQYKKKPAIFLKEVARVIAARLDDLSERTVPDKVEEKIQQDKEMNCSGYVDMKQLGKDLNTMEVSANTSHPREMEKGKEVLLEPRRTVAVGLEFGTLCSGFAYAHFQSPKTINIFRDYPEAGSHTPSHYTRSAIYYKRLIKPEDGQLSFQFKSWGNLARLEYDQDLMAVRKERAQGSSEHVAGTYLTRFKLHLASTDMEITSAQPLPDKLPVEVVITDYLREMGALILKTLQKKYGALMRMKQIQWCVPVPSFWDNAAKTVMKNCMEAAGLVNGVEGSPYPIIMPLELEAASFFCLPMSREKYLEVGNKLLVVDIGDETCNIRDETFKFVKQEVVSICEHSDGVKSYKVKEVTSSSEALWTGYTFLDKPFIEFLHIKIGPCLQECMTKHPTLHAELIKNWDHEKLYFGSHQTVFRIYLPKILALDWMKYDKKMGIRQKNSYDELDISYTEMRSIFLPGINWIVNSLCDQLALVRGVKILAWGGGWSVGSPYIMDKVQELFRIAFPEDNPIIMKSILETLVCEGAVQLALATQSRYTLESTYTVEQGQASLILRRSISKTQDSRC